MTKRSTVFFIIILFSSFSCSNEEVLNFNEKYIIAKKNWSTSTGLAFSDNVSKVFELKASILDDITHCINEAEGENYIHGVFEFLDSGSEYKVYLMPVSEFSKCMELVLEGEALPIPPSYPYYLPYEFSYIE